VCHPRLGLPQLGCTGPRGFVIGQSGGGGGKRRRSRGAPNHGSHRPRWGAGSPSDGTHHHWSKGPTPRTTGASDRTITTAFTDLTDPCHTSTTVAVDAPIHQSRVVGLRYTAGSIDFVRQPGTPTVRSLRHPIQQRLCARVLGLDGWAKLLSGGIRRRGAALREVEELERFGVGGATGGTRSSDGGAANTGGASGASGSVRQTTEERGGGWIG
jgi:hypothetical protein